MMTRLPRLRQRFLMCTPVIERDRSAGLWRAGSTSCTLFVAAVATVDRGGLS